LKRLDATTVYYMHFFAMGLLFSVVFTLNLVYHNVRVGMNPIQLVLVGTVLEATVFLLELPTGVVADVCSRRLSVIVGTVLAGGL
jgi:DHA3 family tetracycline resistance protein-like MFS transporter